MAIEHADFEGVERLAAVLGGEVVSTFDHPELVTMGECEVIEEVSCRERSRFVLHLNDTIANTLPFSFISRS